MYESLLDDARGRARAARSRRRVRDVLRRALGVPGPPPRARRADGERDRRCRRRRSRCATRCASAIAELVAQRAGTRARSAPTSARPTSRCCSPASRTRPRSRATCSPCCASGTCASSSTVCGRSTPTALPGRPLDFAQLRTLKQTNAQRKARRRRLDRRQAALDPPRLTDPRRWVTLAIVVVAAFIVVLDNTVLNVAIPTILREFHTTLPSLEWVDHRLRADVRDAAHHRRPARRHLRPPPHLHHRRRALRRRVVRRVGLARRSPQLVLGEAIIEGIGASLMLPATLAILSTTFHGPRTGDRVRGVGRDRRRRGRVRAGRRRLPHDELLVALGVPHQRDHRPARDHRRAAVHAERRAAPAGASSSTSPGAVLIAVGMFLLVFALSEGGTYGWWTPIKDFTVAGHVVWPAYALDLDHPDRASWLAAIMLTAFVLRRARQGTPQRRTRCSSSRTCGSRRTATGCSPASCSRWASSGSASCCPCSCRTAGTSRRGRTGCGCCRPACS